LERLVKHHGRIRIDALAVEAGLNEIVLTAPMLAIIRDEAVAEEELPERLGEPALIELLPLPDVDLVDDRRVEDEMPVEMKDPRLRYVWIFLLEVKDEGELVLLEPHGRSNNRRLVDPRDLSDPNRADGLLFARDFLSGMGVQWDLRVNSIPV